MYREIDIIDHCEWKVTEKCIRDFKYFRLVIDESECCRKVAHGRRVASPIRALAHVEDLPLPILK